LTVCLVLAFYAAASRIGRPRATISAREATVAGLEAVE
jgi:hypothetical protein